MATASAPKHPERSEHDQRDRALFDAWHDGDIAAGNALVGHYFPRLRRYFITRAQGEHEDLVQETLARLLHKYEDFRTGAFRSFLFGIARMVFLEFLRRRYRLQSIDPWTDSFAGITEGSMSSMLAGREDHRLLLDALGMLTLDQQDLLDLYYWQRLSARELGEVLERKEPTIRSQLAAARKRLGKLFTELGGRPHATEVSQADVERWLLELRSVLERPKPRSEAAPDND